MKEAPKTYAELTERLRESEKSEIMGPHQEGGTTYVNGWNERLAMIHTYIFRERALDVIDQKK